MKTEAEREAVYEAWARSKGWTYPGEKPSGPLVELQPGEWEHQLALRYGRIQEITIQLWPLKGFLGLLIPARTGVCWVHQTSGIARLEMSIEGFYVPLPNVLRDNILKNVGYFEEPYDAALVQTFLEFNCLSGELEPSPQTTHRLHEGWVPVRIKAEIAPPGQGLDLLSDLLLGSLTGQEAILVYPNSD